MVLTHCGNIVIAFKDFKLEKNVIDFLDSEDFWRPDAISVALVTKMADQEATKKGTKEPTALAQLSQQFFFLSHLAPSTRRLLWWCVLFWPEVCCDDARHASLSTLSTAILSFVCGF
eukprot:scpid61537/ scgid7522/ 